MKCKKVIGWFAVSLSILSIAPSIVPGAVSLMGFLLSLLALLLSIFSVEQNSKMYFNTTLSIVVFETLIVNDALRLWESLPMPISTKLAIYAVFTLLVYGSSIAAKRLSSR